MKPTGEMISCDLDEHGKMSSDTQGGTLAIVVSIGYAGSRTTDIWINDTLVQVPNADLLQASKDHNDLCDTEGG